VGEADGAPEVAPVGDVDDAENSVRQVIGAEAAVAGAAPLDLGPGIRESFAEASVALRPGELAMVSPVDFGKGSVLEALLGDIDLPTLFVEGCWDRFEALGAKALCPPQFPYILPPPPGAGLSGAQAARTEASLFLDASLG